MTFALVFGAPASTMSCQFFQFGRLMDLFLVLFRIFFKVFLDAPHVDCN